jgi:hypothetical protein
MINFAVRYQPILALLAAAQPPQVLEVGSGPEGLALFWPGQVVGIDLAFKRTPLHQPLRGSMLALPFATRSWATVISCDTLEHIPINLRRQAIAELARVAGQTLLVAFPSGAAAASCYQQLAHELGQPLPGWLVEHLTYGLPDAAQVADWLFETGWSVRTCWYESTASHRRLMRWETRRWIQPVTYGLTRLAGSWLVKHWPATRTGPFLRALLIARRKPD